MAAGSGGGSALRAQPEGWAESTASGWGGGRRVAEAKTVRLHAAQALQHRRGRVVACIMLTFRLQLRRGRD